MADISERGTSTNWLWGLFAFLLPATVGTWLLSLLVMGSEELDERCAQGMAGPGGPFRVEHSLLPPNVTCVYEDGTTLSSVGFLVWVFWACLIGMVVSAGWAMAVERAERREASAP